jgi:iron complex transport system ATP-binding protein
VAVGEGEGEGVGDGDGERVGTGVGLGVKVGDGVGEAVGLAVLVAIAVGVALGVAVLVATAVAVALGLAVLVAIGVGVALAVSVAEGIGVGVSAAVGVGVGVAPAADAVGVGEGTGVTPLPVQPAAVPSDTRETPVTNCCRFIVFLRRQRGKARAENNRGTSKTTAGPQANVRHIPPTTIGPQEGPAINIARRRDTMHRTRCSRAAFYRSAKSAARVERAGMRQAKQPAAEQANSATIAFENVQVLRAGRTVLDNVTLRIAAGEHVAILGPNGCGKSTLIKTITRECYPVVREGSSLTIFGRDAWNVFELRSLLGIVSPDLATRFEWYVTGREAVLSGFFSGIGLSAHDEPAVTRLMERQADDVLDLLEVPHLAQRPIAQMSSGECRRILIARALVHDPKILVLDEPGTNLDMRAQHELRELLRKLARRGVGIVMVTHDLGDIIPEIERVIFMRGGAIVADGPTETLLTNEPLSALFGIAVRATKSGAYYAITAE